MRQARAVFLSLMLVLCVADGRAEVSECATSPELNARLRALGAWSAARAGELALKGANLPKAIRQGDMFVVPADPTNAPYLREFDLQGRTLAFERQGDSAFSVRNLDLQWDPEHGMLLQLQPPGENHGVVTLDFDFPFHGRNARTIYVTGHYAIYLDPPQSSLQNQFGEAELAAERKAIIAPLMTTSRSRLGAIPAVHVRKDAEAVTVTWISAGRHSIQARLHRSGEIRFSYQQVTRLVAGSLLITSGSEAWRGERAEIASISDPANDQHSGLPQSLSAMLDIRNVSIERVSDLDLFEVRIRMGAAMQLSSLAPNDSLLFHFSMGHQFIRLVLFQDGRWRYQVPVWGSNSNSNAARIEGDEIVMTFLGEHVGLSGPIEVRLWLNRNGTRIDTTSSAFTSIPSSDKRVRTDFSAVSETLLEGRPVAEAFTAPVLSVYRIWEQLKAADPSLRNETIDGVAIYQNFYTDLVMYAGAYSTGGNSGSTGLSPDDESSFTDPRTPALMHMNTVRYGHNATSPGASRVVMHELGHRWLFFASLLEDGVNEFVLNPVSAHPAQFVDTRAAFKVYTDNDTSVMGGGWFTDNRDGTFTSSGYGPYGYSWLDLYLMGLAEPSEVAPMFYLKDANPELGGEYYAPQHETFTATRRNFTVQQVIDGSGRRRPEFPATQRNFRVVFVLVTLPGREPSPDELAAVEEYRALMEKDFRVATGNRGSVVTALTPPPAGPRRRAVLK